MEVIVLGKRPKSDRSRKKATTKRPWTPSTPKRIGKYGTLKPAGDAKSEGLALGPKATEAYRRRRRRD
jgi:hypothetical protein